MSNKIMCANARQRSQHALRPRHSFLLQKISFYRQITCSVWTKDSFSTLWQTNYYSDASLGVAVIRHRSNWLGKSRCNLWRQPVGLLHFVVLAGNLVRHISLQFQFCKQNQINTINANSGGDGHRTLTVLIIVIIITIILSPPKVLPISGGSCVVKWPTELCWRWSNYW